MTAELHALRILGGLTPNARLAAANWLLALNEDDARRQEKCERRTEAHVTQVREVLALIQRSSSPLSPAQINARLRKRTTTNTIGTTLARLRDAGKVRNEGRGKWVAT